MELNTPPPPDTHITQRLLVVLQLVFLLGRLVERWEETEPHRGGAGAAGLTPAVSSEPHSAGLATPTRAGISGPR